MAYRDPARQRACARRHYERNKAAFLERNNKKRSAMRAYVRDLKERTPCADCEQHYPHYIMDFDHRDDVEKVADINALMSALSWTKLLTEIKKCDVVCSNCHRERTQQRLLSA